MAKKYTKIQTLYLLSLVSLFISVFALFFVLLVHFLPDGSFFTADSTQTNVSLAIRAGALQFTRNPSPSLNPIVASTDSQTTTGTLGEIEASDMRATPGVGWTMNLDSITDYISSDRNYRIPLTNTIFAVSNLNVAAGDQRFVSVASGTLRPVDANNDGVSDGAITLAQTIGVLPGGAGSSSQTYRGLSRVRLTPNITLTIPGQLPSQTYTSVYTISVQ